MHIRSVLFLTFTFCIAVPASAQRVSFGAIGGTNLTRDFPISRSIFPDPASAGGVAAFDLFSEGHQFAFGLSAEVRFGKGWALEGDAIHRPLQLQRRFILPDGSVQDLGQTQITTWQFPILLKYRLPEMRRVQPFVTAGPSFRTRHMQAPTEPSQVGATAGAGVEFRSGRLRIAPTLRYTRWQYDGDYPRIATKRDQLEFAVGLNYATSVPSWKIGNRKLRFGVAAGTPLTQGLAQPATERIDELQGYLAGLVAEIELNESWSVEADGLYRPFRGDIVSLGQISPGGPVFETHFEFTVLTWEIPVLAKYRLLPHARVRPVVEAGPSFRLAGNTNGTNPSQIGFTSGAGIETDYKALRISPVVRYTIWAADDQIRGNVTARNQVEVVVGFTF